MTECVIVGPYLPVGETDWRCTTHPEADLIRDPASEGRQIRREDLTCTAATTGPTPEEYRKAAEALQYADDILDKHNAAHKRTQMLFGFDLDYLASVFLGNAANLEADVLHSPQQPATVLDTATNHHNEGAPK